MQPEEARALEAREWLYKASRDLRAGELDLTAIPPFTGDVMFHAQQLAEKALKAFLAWHDEPFRKTHNLTEVGEQRVGFDPTLAPIVKRSADLSDYARKYRYPGEPEEPDKTKHDGPSRLLARCARPCSRGCRTRCGHREGGRG